MLVNGYECVYKKLILEKRVEDESCKKIYWESKTVSIVINFFSGESIDNFFFVDNFFNNKILIK